MLITSLKYEGLLRVKLAKQRQVTACRDRWRKNAEYKAKGPKVFASGDKARENLSPEQVTQIQEFWGSRGHK